VTLTIAQKDSALTVTTTHDPDLRPTEVSHALRTRYNSTFNASLACEVEVKMCGEMFFGDRGMGSSFLDTELAPRNIVLYFRTCCSGLYSSIASRNMFQHQPLRVIKGLMFHDTSKHRIYVLTHLTLN